MKRTVLLYVFFLMPAVATIAQPAKPKEKAKPETPQKVMITPYGFVRNYLNFDSRRTMTVCGGEYNMIPYDEDWNITEIQAAVYGDEERFDRNAVPETHLLALSTRFGLKLEGPQLLGANSSGRIETDFAGFGNNNTVLRLRLAYMRLDWGGKIGQSLTIGQDWHPLSGNIRPEVLGMAAGAPFRPHSRTPQVSYTCWLPWRFGFTAAALWQYQFTSPGPDGESAAYANRALAPELFVGLNYSDERINAQLGVDYTNLDIRREIAIVDGISGLELYKHLDESHCLSFSPTLYFQYTEGKFAMKFRSTLAENLGHLTMLSGYAMVTKQSDPSFMGYKPMRSSVSYLNFAYGTRWRADLFLGYQKNLGLAEGYNIAGFALVGADNLYMKKGVDNINSIYRVAPSISFNTSAFNIGLEYECTAVTYGDLQADGTVAGNDNLRQVVNHRICALVKYNF